MFVCASTECYYDLPLKAALEKLVDLEYSSVEVALHEDANQLKPSHVAANLDHRFWTRGRFFGQSCAQTASEDYGLHISRMLLFWAIDA